MRGKEIIIFLAGLVLGGAGSYFFCKKKFEKVAEEEAEAFKESLNRDELKDQLYIDQQASKLNESIKSASYYDIVKKYEPETHMSDNIYIDPNFFGDDGFKTKEYIYYDEDETLYDTETDEILSSDFITAEDLTHVGDYDDGFLYKRDIEHMTDYEIQVINAAFSNGKQSMGEEFDDE